MFTLAAFIIIFSTLDQEEIGKFIIPLSMPCFLFLVIPKRYLIWNLYSKENLIINSKTISYNYDYGFIRTNLKTIPFYHLGTGIELYKENKGIQEGKLILYNFRAQDNLPEIIHETTVLVNLEDVKEIDIEISKLFLKEFNQTNGFLPFSEN